MKNPLRSPTTIALAMAATLVVAACSADSPGATTATPVTAPPASTSISAAPTAPPSSTTAGTTPAEPPSLVVGGLVPVTGDYAIIGPAITAGARVAVEEVNQSGGVFGEDVIWIESDSGDLASGLAPGATAGLLAEGVDVIVGAAASSVSESVIDMVVAAGTILFSPSNTSPIFTTYDDEGLYFRTAPSDALQGRMIAQLVAEQGRPETAVVFRDDLYGQGLSEAFAQSYLAVGGDVVAMVAYDPAASEPAGIVDELEGTGADAILVVGLDESGRILEAMHAAGLGPTAVPVWGVDGNITRLGGQVEDPAILAGMRGTVPGSEPDAVTLLFDRMDEAIDGGVGGVYEYGPESYDAVIITALAARLAAVDDPVAIAAEINGVTRGGEVCTTFADCATLVDQGADIDYDGPGGRYEFVPAGEPGAASYRVATYDGEVLPNPDLDVFVEVLY
jgi:branched-chain amino acid transport system substrate-binding protein